MIVDSSALVALIEGEPGAEQVAAVLAGDRSPVIGAPTLAATLVVLTARHGPVGRAALDRLSTEINLGAAPFTAEHAHMAQRAYLRFGRGRHPAKLHFGDCLTYATAALAQEPLLALGDDFPQTDLEFGDGIVGYWPAASPADASPTGARLLPPVQPPAPWSREPD